METRMRVEFEYETQDRESGEDVLLTVRGEVDLGTPAVLDRRPEHCEPGESATAEIDVTDPDGAELDAARTAGMATALAGRPGNREPGGIFDHEAVATFSEIVT
jgi:hypothetical protein